MDRQDTLARRNRRVAIAAFGTVAGMVGLSFASVPLYDMFCRMTGYNGTVQTGGPAAPGAVERKVTVRFSANTHPSLPWRFEAAQNAMQVHLGEEGLAFYSAANTAERPVEGVATYNVTPEVVGKYFHKVACFCFDAQTLQPGQSVEMPVSFWVDPAMANDPNTRDIRTITLNYTFFRTLADAERSGALASAGPHVGRGTVTR
ncbi:cytochrome c oxidase assembly protein [Roseomonas sp. SSH11]|uniref:Cytochrome c oxidase assembly protein CtaG n=1 Tax=Pararoseomonas baculiformis TaxID=2820812 RepID=A0ABS4AK48_9PROT|nr:cytochrome c oxidase assembly protein [Pararoseomonas baculiformis]MBP0447418.1 cytochrome c oxidase assembly protein [Pararoseomonas baculiformis]